MKKLLSTILLFVCISVLNVQKVSAYTYYKNFVIQSVSNISTGSQYGEMRMSGCSGGQIWSPIEDGMRISVYYTAEQWDSNNGYVATQASRWVYATSPLRLVVNYTGCEPQCALGETFNPVTTMCEAPKVCTAHEIKVGSWKVPGKWPAAVCIDGCYYKEQSGTTISLWDVNANETLYTDPIGIGQDCATSDGSMAASPEPWPADKIVGSGPVPVLVKLPDGSLKPDQDKDGIPSGPAAADGGDTDNNGDGKPNGFDPDVDGNGTPNTQDTDVDGDGISNGGQTDRWDYPYASPAQSGGLGADVDIDGDGQLNGVDMDIDGDGIPNKSDGDIDGDGHRNDFDLDADGDGIPNLDDTSPYGNGGGTGDGTDGTGTGTDTDGDGEEDEEPGPVVNQPTADPTPTCQEGRICPADGVCQEGESPTSADCSGPNYMTDRFQQFKEDIADSGIMKITGTMSVPSGGSSTMGVDFGEWGGVQTFDFAQFGAMWAALNALFTITTAWYCVKIIALKKG